LRFFFQAEDGIRDYKVTGVQTCALPIVKEAGATVDVVSPESGEIKGWEMKDWGHPVKVDRKLADVSADNYDAIVLPGGQINPDRSEERRVGQECRCWGWRENCREGGVCV